VIEPTDEMIAAFEQAAERPVGRNSLAGLAAVLAIVERDYEPIRCDKQSWAGHRCTKPRGHENGHYHRFSGVVWP
jgi:hypothetical protein